MSAIGRNQRYTKSNRCPICGGCDSDPRGQGKRCSGFSSEDGAYAMCSRDEHAGGLAANDIGLYPHLLSSICRCGVPHEPASGMHAVELPRGPRIVEANYDYFDENDRCLFRVVRYQGKDFRQCRPDGLGGWIWKLEDVRRVLFRLPQLLAARLDSTVWIVEGEKDVGTLTSMGLLATCSPHGAGKWRQVAEHASAVLSGRQVVVWADADVPGRKHAQDVAAGLLGAAAGVRVIESPDGLGKDASDYFGLGGSLERLTAQVAATPLHGPKLRLVASGRQDGPPAWLDDEPPQPPGGDERQGIIIGPVVHENVDKLDEALSRAGAVYHRARSLVQVLPAVDLPGIADETPILKQVTNPSLLDLVSRHVKCLRWERPRADAIKLGEKTGEIAKPELSETIPPNRTALDPLMQRGHWTHIRPIRAVTESPMLRPDGSILQTPGYDAVSGYLYSPRIEFPRIDESPSRDAACAALLELEQVFQDFPHVSRAHRMVPIAALLTILARAAVRAPTPAFVFDASQRGSGKTLQGDTVHAIATGRRAPHCTLRQQEEEREKTLGSYALAGARVVFVDNVKGQLGGPALEATLTSETVSFRVLGGMQIAELPWVSVVLVSGNNLQLTEDMVRRCLLSRLESPLEDPTLRTDFLHPELVTWAISERARLLSLALTLLSSYVSHGSPDVGAGTMGEPYGPWCRLVASAIMFAGGPNVLECRPPRESVGLDEFGAIRVLMYGWHRLDPGGHGMTVGGIVRALRAPGPHDPPDGNEDLREALESIAMGKSGRVDSATLSRALRRHRDRIVDTRRFTSSVGGDAGLERWSVQALG